MSLCEDDPNKMYHVTIEVNEDTNQKIDQNDLLNEENERQGEMTGNLCFQDRRASPREVIDNIQNGSKVNLSRPEGGNSPTSGVQDLRKKYTFSPEPRLIELPTTESRLKTLPVVYPIIPPR